MDNKKPPKIMSKQIDKCNETNSLTLKFTCSNEKVIKNESVISQMIRFKLITYFNPLVDFFLSINEKKSIKGLSQKEAAIMDMPIDLLYLHAAYYVDTFKRLNEDSEGSLESVFKKRCEKILQIFNEIDLIWNLRDKPHKMDTPELQSLLASYIIDESTSNSNDFAGINSIVDSFNVKNCCNYISMAKHLREKNSENDKQNFLHSLIPTVFEIKKRVYDNYKRYKIFDFFSRNILKNLVLLSLTYPFLVPYVLLNNKTLDAKYRQILLILSSQLESKNNKVLLPCLGYLEKNVKKSMFKFDLNAKIIKNISLNYALREILCEDVLVGCVGKKKCGKSSFVELMGCPANASAIKATEFISPFKICDNIILFDYPHFNSQDVSHKIQFYFTRTILDYVFVIDKVIDNAETEDTHVLYNILKNNNNKRFSLIFNRLDDVLSEIRKEEDASKLVENLRDKMLKKLGIEEKDFSTQKRVYLTIIDKSNLNFEDRDLLAMTSYLDAANLRKTVFNTILEYLPKALEKFNKSREEIIKQMNAQSLEENIKEITIVYEEQLPIQVKITLDPALAQETKPKIYANFQTLTKMIKQRFECDKGLIEIHSIIQPNVVFDNIEDLFKSKYLSFIAIEKSL
jgi:hypothetical protein